MSSNPSHNPANKVVIYFNNQPSHLDDATLPNLPVQDIPIIETPRIEAAALQPAEQAEPAEQKGGWFSRMKQGLSKSRTEKVIANANKIYKSLI